MAGQTRDVESAELLLPSRDVAADIAFWTSAALGFRLRQIYPADDPRVAVLSGHGLRLRLDRAIATSTSTTTDTTNTNTTTTAPASSSPPGGPVIRLLCREQPPIPDGDGSRKKMEAAEAETTTLTSPSGTRVEFAPAAEEAFPTPATAHAFRVGRLLPTTTSTADADADNAEADDAGWVVGRAGMHYRDLVPSRLGGAVVASHIRIPTAGPVADGVHFHNVGFQLIFCVAGWVRLVYEDQGPPFVLAAGDCVIQPPRIRHRVLEASAGLQVVEVGVPAEHMTTLDWDMELPTPVHRPDREWDDQRFGELFFFYCIGVIIYPRPVLPPFLPSAHGGERGGGPAPDLLFQSKEKLVPI
ncbi:hypothetical protein GGR56DRAFT_658148, partial [Xylariaceae sp. FL0804]